MSFRLFQFYLDGIDEKLYVYSNNDDSEYLRDVLRNNDHGSIDSDLYDELTEYGSVKEILTTGDIPDEDLEWTPYCAPDLEKYFILSLWELCE